MTADIIKKYNVTVPRYTSYPPANFFSDKFSTTNYIKAIEESNDKSSNNISFYIHIPFCRHMCHYCGCNSIPTTTKERMNAYVDAIKRELAMIIGSLDKNRKVSQIHYGGGSPTTLSTSILKEINDTILSSFKTIEKPEIAIECHPGYLDLEYWSELAKAGFTRVSIGIQDFNTTVLKGVNRRPSLESIEDVFKILRSAGISINLDFIYGLPFQTPESFEETIKKAIQLSPDRIVTFSYAHVPWVNKSMLILEKIGLPSTQIKKTIFNNTKELLIHSGYIAIGMDHFVKPSDELNISYKNGALHRNFQGYCTRRTTGEVYGIGVSAISQLSKCYSQNTKDVATYVELISQNKFTTIKGYQLSFKELITKELIDMLMCNNKVDWEKLSDVTNLSISELQELTGYSESLLTDVLNDNIITLTEHGFEVTTEGKVFIRNVASLFDPLYTTINSYSKPI